MTRTLRTVITAALIAYTLFVLAIAVWPTRVDKPIDAPLRTAINQAHDAGAPRHLGYSLIENVANAGLFFPLALLLALLLATRRIWIAPVACFLFSVGIELTQYFYIAGRSGTVTDVISNTSGAVIATLVVVAIRLWLSGRTAKRTPRIELTEA